MGGWWALWLGRILSEDLVLWGEVGELGGWWGLLMKFGGLILGSLLVVMVVIDMEKKIIPDWLNLGILGVVLGMKLGGIVVGGGGWDGLGGDALVAALAGLVFWGLHLVAYKIYQQDAFGLGDVKLIMVLAFWLGWPLVVTMILGAFGVGAIVGVVLAALTRQGRHLALPFGPFLAIGTAFALLWGEQLWSWLFLGTIV